MPDIKVVLCPTLDSAKEYCDKHSVAATVEAEYGDVCVQGRDLTLAHHGSRADNPAPCNDSKAVELPEGAIVVVSHLDLDTVGGLMALAGNKPQNDSFWKSAEFIDVNGPHHIYEVPDADRLSLNAFYCESGKDRPPRFTEPTDVTSNFQHMADIVKAAVLETDPRHDAMIEAGKQWVNERDTAVQNCLVYEDKYTRAFITDGSAFCAAAYANPETHEVKPATVTLNTKFGSITVGSSDTSIFSAKDTVQELWGEGAGGRDGIAGSPRGQVMDESAFYAAVNKVSEKCEEVMKAKEVEKPSTHVDEGRTLD